MDKKSARNIIRIPYLTQKDTDELKAWFLAKGYEPPDQMYMYHLWCEKGEAGAENDCIVLATDDDEALAFARGQDDVLMRYIGWRIKDKLHPQTFISLWAAIDESGKISSKLSKMTNYPTRAKP